MGLGTYNQSFPLSNRGFFHATIVVLPLWYRVGLALGRSMLLVLHDLEIRRALVHCFYDMTDTFAHTFSCFLLQAERLADYGRLLGGSQPALDGRRRDLDRIQDLFPHDYLGLHETEPNSTYHAVSLACRVWPLP